MEAAFRAYFYRILPSRADKSSRYSLGNGGEAALRNRWRGYVTVCNHLMINQRPPSKAVAQSPPQQRLLKRDAYQHAYYHHSFVAELMCAR